MSINVDQLTPTTTTTNAITLETGVHRSKHYAIIMRILGCSSLAVKDILSER